MGTETIQTNIWVSNGTNYVFAENRLPQPPRQTAVCFSGGGTRALSAAFGQLRGLHALGLMDQVGYIYTYYRSGANNDDELLGPVTAPADIRYTDLEQMPSSRLGYTATVSLRDALLKLVEEGMAADRLWLEGVGRVFLEPFGLHDTDNPAHFSLDAATVADIVARNPQLAGATFYTAREKRPFLLINGTLLGPDALAPFAQEKIVGFAMTPLYVGVPYAQTITYQSKGGQAQTQAIGGGYVEPFAFGGSAPLTPPQPTAPGVHSVTVLGGKRPFTLTDASGISSSAFAAIADQLRIANTLDPEQPYWPINSGNFQPATTFTFGDGGNIENYGLIPLLLRGIKRIVVFVNSETKLSLDYNPSKRPGKKVVDAFLPPLFGFPNKLNPNNRVFTKQAWQSVITALQAQKKQGLPLVTVQKQTVQPNKWWGLQGGWDVEICWVYNDRVASWEQQLPRHLQEQIKFGNAPIPLGSFRHFPNYLTVDEDLLDIVKLTPAQVNLLADLSCWNVLQSESALRALLA
jgi:hypothetical protein